MVDVQVDFARPRVSDPAQAALAALADLPALGGLEQGQIVAVTAGSRGIANIVSILRAVCGRLRSLGVEPVVVAAMGSHGGDTAEGKRDLLASLGITPEAVGAQVRSSTEAVEVGRTAAGTPVWLDRFAVGRAAGVLLVNRIKPHTAFRGPTESGLLKMAAVGLGHQRGAREAHAPGPERMAETIRAMARVALEKVTVLGGLAILENAYDETAEILGLGPQSLWAEEERLLERARLLMPRLPVSSADVLIVERMGKEISGTGMDTNVVGRQGPAGGQDRGPEGYAPSFRRIVVLDLTRASQGNATGIGLADFTTDRVVSALDRKSTYTNCLTSTLIDRARLPLYLPDDRQAIAAAVISLGSTAPEDARIVQIRDTLHLCEVRVSTNLVALLDTPPGADLRVFPGQDPDDEQRRPRPLTFDAEGRLGRITSCGE